MRIVISDHACARYAERVRPGIATKQARKEVEALVAMARGETQDDAPWSTDFHADAYLILSDGVCLALTPERGVLVAVTTLTRAEVSPAQRAEKNKRRRQRARARKTRSWHAKHTERGRPREAA